MKRILTAAFFIAFFLSVSCFLALAADKGKVQLTFRTLGIDQDLPNVYYKNNEESVSIVTSKDQRSADYLYDGPPVLELFSESESPEPLCKVDLSQAGSYPLLMISRSVDEPGKLMVRSLPEDLQNFPLGTFRFFNRTEEFVSVVLGAANFDLEPGAIQLIQTKPDAERTTLLVQVFQTVNGEKKLLSSGNWSWNPSLRTLVLVEKSAGPNAMLKMTRLSDVGPTEPVEKSSKTKKRKK